MKTMAIVLLFSASCLAQPEPATDWVTTYHGSGNARLHALLATADGGCIAAGEVAAGPGEPSDFLVVRFNASGDTMWTGCYGDSLADKAQAICAAADGGFIIAGDSEEINGFRDGLVLNIDSEGTLLWQKRLGWVEQEDFLRAVVPLPDGDFALAGTFHDQCLLARLDQSGDTLWTRRWDLRTGYTDLAHSLELTDDGGFLIGGQSYHDNYEWIDRYRQLIRTDSAGNLLWWDENYDGRYYAAIELADGNLAVAGEYQAAYLYLARFDSDGGLIWSHIYGTATYNMIGFDMAETASGDLIVVGKEQTGPGLMDAVLLRVDAEGEELWRLQYDLAGMDSGHALAILPDNSYLLAGGSQPGGDAFLIHTGTDSPQAVASVRSASLAAIYEFSAYPNPCNPDLSIVFRLAAPGHSRVELFNLQGQHVAELAEGVLGAGVHRYQLQTDALASGIYFVSVQSDNSRLVRRITVLH